MKRCNSGSPPGSRKFSHRNSPTKTASPKQLSTQAPQPVPAPRSDREQYRRRLRSAQAFDAEMARGLNNDNNEIRTRVPLVFLCFFTPLVQKFPQMAPITYHGDSGLDPMTFTTDPPSPTVIPRDGRNLLSTPAKIIVDSSPKPKVMSDRSSHLSGLAAAHWSRVSYRNLSFDATRHRAPLPTAMTLYFDVTSSPARSCSSPTRRHKKTTIPEKAKAEIVLSTKSKLPLTYTAISPHAIIAQESESTNIDSKLRKRTLIFKAKMIRRQQTP
ncbi:uncharacterized protein K441DRAFT_691898 [Cenococcum geophilum 1.58]|uniref:uncharacterized protein n=1 Tax=Cenococcum geophilum 1.58 TaxID=794803 RepID=UPI00358E0E87|nr:hypothetical protein K441DRAFT_691898 [Cenococcum geophilum 1.58]